VNAAGDRHPPRIAVVADDLIWGTRLADGVRRAGGEPRPVRHERDLPGGLDGASGAIVDMTARAYDPLAVLRAAAARDLPAIAFAPHDDATLRRLAREAGAARVHPYRALFERGDAVLGAWLATRTTEVEEAGR
jgi:hypothetical protein